MKVISRFVIVLGAVALLASLPASAVCGLASSFASDYFTGTSNDVSTAAGVFWAVGQLNPAPATGHDNGLWPPSDPFPVGWVREVGGDVYLAGDWAGDARVDGCIQDPPNPQPAKMAFAIAMTGSTPGSTVYVAGCDEEDALGNFFFAGLASAPLSKPVVQNSVRGVNNVQVTVAPPPVGGGIINSGACGLSVSSYRVYTQNVPRNGGAPASRNRTTGGWVAASPGTGTANPTSVTVSCTGNEDVYLAYSLVVTESLGGTHELGLVGANSTVVQCGATSAEPPKNFKIIKKPVRTKTQ